MHVSVCCRPELFTAQRGGRQSPLGHIMPGWTPADRIGVVVDEPFGAVGASALIQAAIALFYEAQPQRRRDQYPPVFVFHVGGPHGDFSPMDVWPARKEVFLTAGDPYALLGAITDRAITRLLLPEGGPDPADTVGVGPEGDEAGDPGWLTRASSGWTDIASFRERLASAYAYSPAGCVQDPDTTVSTGDEQCESMVEDVLDPHRCYDDFARCDDESLLARGIGPSTVSDLRLWLEAFASRLDEVGAQHRSARLEERRAARRGAVTVQTYRSLDDLQAIDLLGRVGLAAGRQNAIDPAKTMAA